MNTLYRAVARVKGEQEWKPVTWGGQNFYASEEVINELIEPMRKHFPANEYNVEPHNLS